MVGATYRGHISDVSTVDIEVYTTTGKTHREVNQSWVSAVRHPGHAAGIRKHESH